MAIMSPVVGTAQLVIIVVWLLVLCGKVSVDTFRLCYWEQKVY